jgi:hypothetical protein
MVVILPLDYTNFTEKREKDSMFMKALTPIDRSQYPNHSSSSAAATN